MSIQDKINRLQTAKTDIAGAITAKGGTVNEGDGFEEFSADIATIESGYKFIEEFSIENNALESVDFRTTSPITIEIPEGVTTISTMAFYSNSFVEKVVFPESVTSIEHPDPFHSKYYGVFQDCVSLKEVLLNEGLTSIGSTAFANCKLLTSVSLPSTLTYIGQSAFSECSSLMSISIPSGVTALHGYTFNRCFQLSNIYIPETLVSMKGSDFDHTPFQRNNLIANNGLFIVNSILLSIRDTSTKVLIPSSVHTLNPQVFEDNSAIRILGVPDSITEIPGMFCRNARNLHSVVLPSSVIEIGQDAFNGTALTDVYYKGTETEWIAIDKYWGNDPLNTATIHYNYTGDGSEL